MTKGKRMILEQGRADGAKRVRGEAAREIDCSRTAEGGCPRFC